MQLKLKMNEGNGGKGNKNVYTEIALEDEDGDFVSLAWTRNRGKVARTKVLSEARDNLQKLLIELGELGNAAMD